MSMDSNGDGNILCFSIFFHFFVFFSFILYYMEKVSEFILEGIFTEREGGGKGLEVAFAGCASATTLLLGHERIA